MPFDSVKALAFDVFGTVVDLRGSLPRQCEQFGLRHGIVRAWQAVAADWISEYLNAIDAILAGAPFRTVDILTREALEKIVGLHDLSSLTAPEKNELNLAWRRLDPWPDAVAGLQRLRGRFQIVTLANGNVSLLRDIASYAGLPWHQILSAAVVKRYKPDAAVYEYGIVSLGFEPGEIMMVAAHSYDLDAAKKPGGMMTAFVMRPGEDDGQSAVTTPDVRADDFNDLADQLLV